MKGPLCGYGNRSPSAILQNGGVDVDSLFLVFIPTSAVCLLPAFQSSQDICGHVLSMECLFPLLVRSRWNIGGDSEPLTGCQSVYRTTSHMAPCLVFSVTNEDRPFTLFTLPLGPLGTTSVAGIPCSVLVLACAGRFSDPASLPPLIITYVCVHLLNTQ